MSKTITGIQAAWMEHEGQGQFSLRGRTVTFLGSDGYSAQWILGTTKLAAIQLKVFRAATKYPETRNSHLGE